MSRYYRPRAYCADSWSPVKRCLLRRATMRGKDLGKTPLKFSEAASAPAPGFGPQLETPSSETTLTILRTLLRIPPNYYYVRQRPKLALRLLSDIMLQQAACQASLGVRTKVWRGAGVERGLRTRSEECREIARSTPT